MGPATHVTGSAPLFAEGSFQGRREVSTLGIDDSVPHEPHIATVIHRHHQTPSGLGAPEFRFPTHAMNDVDHLAGEQLIRAGEILCGDESEVAAMQERSLPACERLKI
jgi:hypothetical protein